MQIPALAGQHVHILQSGVSYVGTITRAGHFPADHIFPEAWVGLHLDLDAGGSRYLAIHPGDGTEFRTLAVSA